MKYKLFNHKGLTLIELIITIALLGIIISFMFIFFQFNYSTFFRSNNKYDLQTSMNNAARLIEEELKFADEMNIYSNEDSIYNTKNYIFLEDNLIKIKKVGYESKDLIKDDLIIVDKLWFKLDENLLTFQIKGQNVKSKEEFTVESTIELLNMKDVDNMELEGSIIEYFVKGDD